ncbi:MFS transporter [Nocardioides montaniterrae]
MTAGDQLHDIGGRRAYAIWLTALAAYVLAIFHRSSLGVAGLMAEDRFGISATQLSLFTVLQLILYAGLQIPVGVLLDRFGSKRLILAGVLMMSAGQLAFAFAGSFPAALGARALVGAGDAMIFVSVIRLVTLWFLARRTPLVSQLTGQLGQLGALAAATPLTLALHHLGWTPAFLIASGLGALVIVAVLALVRDSPYARREAERVKLEVLARSLRQVWAHPGTRLGMWTHFTSQFSTTVFAMLWGFPFLVRGEGWSTVDASTLLMAMTGWVIVSGLVLSWVTARWPYYRSYVVVGIVLAIVVMWSVVLSYDERAPVWLIVALAFVIATGGPASMVGFDLARIFAPVTAIGRANGLVNIGGFLASLITMALVGVVLDQRAPGGASTYTLDDFRVALCVQYLFWALGVVQILRYRRRAVAHLRREHPGAIERMRGGEHVVHLGLGGEIGV